MKLISRDYFLKNKKPGNPRRINIDLSSTMPDGYNFFELNGEVFIYDYNLDNAIVWDLKEEDLKNDNKLDFSDWSLQKISDNLSHTINNIYILENFRSCDQENNCLPEDIEITDGTWELKNNILGIDFKFSLKKVDSYLKGVTYVNYGLDEKSKFPFNIDDIFEKEKLITLVIEGICLQK